VRRDLDNPTPGSTGLLVRDGTGGNGAVLAYAHVAPSDTFSPRHWSIGLVVDPAHRDGAVARPLLDAAVAHIASHGGGRAVLWAFAPDASDDALAAGAGFEPDRDLLQVRVALPLAEPVRWPPGIETRYFECGRDENAWLEVNNRAFGNHPEQGGWIRATLLRRMAEPWFDPSLFLLAFDRRGLVGFNWCKAHPGQHPEPPLGEIFVIGVDPRARRSGLGRALALAGLERLASRGLSTGMLFVDATNTAALALYERLGFTVYRIDRAYRYDVPAR